MTGNWLISDKATQHNYLRNITYSFFAGIERDASFQVDASPSVSLHQKLQYQIQKMGAPISRPLQGDPM